MKGWLFQRFILRRIVQNPVRLILLVLAVAGATTLIASVARVSTTAIASFEESLGMSPEAYPLIIAPRGGRLTVESLGRCLAALEDDFDIAAYRKEVGSIRIEGASLPIAVVGVTASSVKTAPVVTDGEFLFSAAALRNLRLAPGASVELSVGDVRLSGRVAVAGQLADSLPAISVVVPLALFSRGAGQPVLDAVLLRPRAAQPAERYRAALAGWFDGCTTSAVPLQVETAQTRIQRGESLMAAYRLNVMIMAGMTLLVCALLVSQATQLSLRTLSRELSILRTLGIGRLACLLSVVQESTIIAASGAIVGVTLGEPLIVRITELFLQTAFDIYQLSLGARSVNLLVERSGVVIVMVVLCVAGAAFGGIGALRVPPSLGTRSAFRQAQPIHPQGALLCASAGVLANTVVGLVAYTFQSTFLAYLFIASNIICVVSIVPYVILIAPKALCLIKGSLYVWFARGGVLANGRSFLLGAIGASVSMMLICALSIMVGSFRQTLDVWAEQRLQGDLFVSAALEGDGNEARIPPHVADRVARVPGVSRLIPYYETMSSYGPYPLIVSASDTAAQLDRGVYVLRSGSLNRSALESGTGALISESAARKLKLAVGDLITVDGDTFSVLAVIQEFGTEHPLVQIEAKRFLSRYPGQWPENLTIDLEPGANIHAVRGQVTEAVGPLGVVRDNRELRALVLTLFDRTFQITLSIRWIVFGLAALGLMLAALQHLWERRREIKTMHVLGCAPREIVGAHVVESVVVCALPVLVGLAGGVLMGWGLTALVNPRSFGWSLTFGVSFVPLVIAIGFIAVVALVVAGATGLFLHRTIQEATLSDE